MKGTLHGVGVGPGDPDLITRAAARLIATAPVVAYPQADDAPSFARSIAADLLGHQIEEPIVVPMRAARHPAAAVYDEASLRLGAHLDAGRDVVVLCEGDPMHYGSFMYLLERMRAAHRVRITPGVSSVLAAAAAIGRPIAARDDGFVTIPATLPDEAIEQRISANESIAIIKLGRHLPRVRALLERLGLTDRAVYCERVGLPAQRLSALADASDAAPYFSLLLIYRGSEPAIASAQSSPPADPAVVPETLSTLVGPATAGAVALVLNPASAPAAGRLADAMTIERRFYHPRFPNEAASFDDFASELRSVHAEGRPIIAFAASGIVIRALAPVLGDKHDEPPVLAISPDGRSVVPLLGGHGGANALARRAAAVLDGHAALTTAGEASLGVALDDPSAGWTLAAGDAKAAMAALLAGAGLNVDPRLGWPAVRSLARARRGALAQNAIVTLVCRDLAGPAAGPLELVYRPRRYALGVGCERGASVGELADLVRDVLAEADVGPGSIALVSSLDLKADERAVEELARALGVPARFHPAHVLEAETARLATPSEVVFAEVGCHGVAEGAALVSTGPDGELVVPKRKGARTTAALARAPEPIDANSIGRARGSLRVVGIGPGSPEWRSPEATRALRGATDWVGYSLYLDLVAELGERRRHDFPLGAEEDRVRFALELAGEGRDVALVCSGDAGIYAMASLAMELVDRGEVSDAARRVALAVCPGISALQAAAARIGAPLGHDFCTISLSDLLTPWPDIERRIRAAAEGDFVIAFYNPVSKRRRTQLAHAKTVLLRHRPPGTPVVLATNLGRDAERVRVVSLNELDVDDVDMLTVVLVGSTNTKRFRTGDGRDRVYTPRGYDAKPGTGIANPMGERP